MARSGSIHPYWQLEKARVAAEVLAPAVTFSGVLGVVELVCRSEGLQSGVLVPSVVNARASIVYVTAPVAGAEGFWVPAVLKAPTLGLSAGTESV